VIPSQLTGIDPESVVDGEDERAQVRRRAIVVKRLKPLPIEAVARGYLIGSGWKDYLASGKVCGIDLPAGLQLAQQLPQPIFTPATKADVGDHDENIDYATVEKLIGVELAAKVRDVRPCASTAKPPPSPAYAASSSPTRSSSSAWTTAVACT
jgi:phosphoribosylaminoimidazole-succinocarboxamide synthase